MRKLLVVAVLLVAAFPLSARRRAVRHPETRPLTAIEWLQAKSYPIHTTDARSGLVDLHPLRHIVGDARMVSLGEATHGTSEFFTMKHRILEYLVEEMGFTVFAIEANLPEADAVDEYVLHGTGNARDALSGMYFWTWDTAEVLDMIEWMREYNLRRGERPPVRFRGFDAQFIDKAVPAVEAYVARVDAQAVSGLKARYDCIRDVVNPNTYIALPAATRSACAARLVLAYEELQAKRETYVARSSATEFENHLRYARVVVQTESGWTRTGSRDVYMAENVEWLADVAHPGEKMVLWAHNYHVAFALEQQMGFWLRKRFQAAVVTFGFDFDRGTFTAHGPGSTFGVQSTGAIVPDGWEELFRQAGKPSFLLDLRDTESSPEAAALLLTPKPMWLIGALWNPSQYVAYHRWPVAIRKAFDVLVYIEESTATAVH